MDNYDPDKLILRPITDLLKIEHRKQLVPNLFHAKGVTTFVAPSGGGKTTTVFSAALYIATGVWGDEVVEKRPLIWIPGEDQDGLRAIYEAWLTHNPDHHPDAHFIDEAVDFSNDDEVGKLIELIKAKGVTRPLIMADALADILGSLNEDKSQDINRVYRNVWRVVNAFDASFGVLHHSGWVEKRERGSTAIRAKSNILVQVVRFDPEAGIVELKHHKLRGGKPLKQFFLGVKLIPVNGYSEPIPIITGPIPDKAQPETDQSSNARKVVHVMAHFPNGSGTFTEMETKFEQEFGLKKTAFVEGLRFARDKGWITGGGRRGQPYSLQPEALENRSANGALGLVRRSPPTGGEPKRTNEPVRSEPKTHLNAPTDQREVAKSPIQPSRPKTLTKSTNAKTNTDWTAVPLAPEPGVNYADLDAFGEAMDQIAARPSRSGAR